MEKNFGSGLTITLVKTLYPGGLTLAGTMLQANFILDHGHDRFEDLIVTGATAEIPRHPFLDLFFGGIRLAIQQGLGRYDLPWSTDPSLKTSVFEKGLLNGVEFSTLC